MITSALISECRREFDDQPQTTRKVREGDGSSTVFNLGDTPILEGSYSIYDNNLAQTETSDFTLDLDNGDLVMVSAPNSGEEVRAEFKHAHWRDKHWNEAINQAIEELNGRGYFRQVHRTSGIVALSASVRKYNGPSACVDIYEIYKPDNNLASGNYNPLNDNWNYQQDSNTFVVGTKPAQASPLEVSYLRRMQTYDATSATLDVKDDWLEVIKKRAGAIFYRHMAGKIAKQGNASIDEGHFSFTNLRTMSNDLTNEFDTMALRAKPTRPAKDMQWNIPTRRKA